jgi:hypothetical protein
MVVLHGTIAMHQIETEVAIHFNRGLDGVQLAVMKKLSHEVNVNEGRNRHTVNRLLVECP